MTHVRSCSNDSHRPTAKHMHTHRGLGAHDDAAAAARGARARRRPCRCCSVPLLPPQSRRAAAAVELHHAAPRLRAQILLLRTTEEEEAVAFEMVISLLCRFGSRMRQDLFLVARVELSDNFSNASDTRACMYASQ